MKKNKYFQFLVVPLIFFLAIGLSSKALAIDLSKSKIKVPVVRTQQSPVPESVKPHLNASLQNDVKIRSIVADQCKCDLQDVDAVYMKGVKAVLYNSGPATARDITVTLTYYLFSGEQQEIVRRIAQLPPNEIVPLNMSQPGQPFLAKWSRGFVATIQAANDKHRNNNQFRIQNCQGLSAGR